MSGWLIAGAILAAIVCGIATLITMNSRDYDDEGDGK